MSGSAGRSRSISSAPNLTEPLPSKGTRLPSPAPHLFQLPALLLLPPPPPPQVPLGSRSLSSGSPSRLLRRCSPGPFPSSLLPSLHLAPEAATATGAVRRTPTPSPGYFPPPRSRDSCTVPSGNSRETHHHGSGCSRSSPALELESRRGLVWGLEAAGGGGGSLEPGNGHATVRTEVRPLTPQSHT